MRADNPLQLVFVILLAYLAAGRVGPSTPSRIDPPGPPAASLPPAFIDAARCLPVSTRAVIPTAPDSERASRFFVWQTLAAPATYAGLIHPVENSASSFATEGFLYGTLDASGIFTAKLNLGGLTHAFSAFFFPDGSALFAGKQSTLSLAHHTLSLHRAGDVIQVTLTGIPFSSAGTLTRAAYSKDRPAPAALLGGGVDRAFQVQFPPMAELGGSGDRIVPSSPVAGHGTGKLLITQTGSVYLVGTLDDGTLVTCASALMPGNTAPLYFELPARDGHPTGSFSGTISLTSLLQDLSSPDDANLLWFHPVPSP
jgi:hypothetical protein